MRVTICADALSPNPGGIGRYTWELCKGLADRNDLRVQYFARGRLIEDPESLLLGHSPNERSKGLRRIERWRDTRKIRGSIFHGPNFFLPRSVDSGIITVHDLSVFRYPETHPADRIRAFEAEFGSSLTRAAHVITDTETVRQELIADFGVSPERVSAVHLGVEAKFCKRSVNQLTPQLLQFGLELKSYALCVSTLEPRKKIGNLLIAWRRLPAAVRAQFPLVLAGGSGWLNDQLRAEIERGAAEGWLRYLGFVEEDKLPALYGGAALFVYPSVYEGFGLPPLEAMASGTPVVVSSLSCMPEVCGDAPRYVDPNDTDQLTSALEESLMDVEWQKAAAERGLERSKAFVWNRCIEQTVSIYRKAAAIAQ